MTRIKLLVVLPTLQGGGAERVMLTLLRNFNRARFEPMLAVVDGRDADYRDEVPPDVRLLDLGCRRVSRAGPAILRLIWQWRPHVVLSTLSHLNLMLALLRPLLPRTVRLVARESITLSAFLDAEAMSTLWRIGYRRLYRRFDAVICPSRAMRDDLCANFALPAPKATVVANPLDLDRIRHQAGAARPRSEQPPRRLLALGRLAPQKGLDTLLDAMAHCADLRVRLDIVGKGSSEAELRSQIDRLHLGDRVRLQGFADNPYDWLRRADALVLASRYEGLPNVVLESLACGTPVISTPLPEAREILDGMAHCVIADGFSSNAIERAIRAWHARPLARVEPEATCRWSVERIARRYEQVISDVAIV